MELQQRVLSKGTVHQKRTGEKNIPFQPRENEKNHTASGLHFLFLDKNTAEASQWNDRGLWLLELPQGNLSHCSGHISRQHHSVPPGHKPEDVLATQECHFALWLRTWVPILSSTGQWGLTPPKSQSSPRSFSSLENGVNNPAFPIKSLGDSVR